MVRLELDSGDTHLWWPAHLGFELVPLLADRRSYNLTNSLPHSLLLTSYLMVSASYQILSSIHFLPVCILICGGRLPLINSNIHFNKTNHIYALSQCNILKCNKKHQQPWYTPNKTPQRGQLYTKERKVTTYMLQMYINKSKIINTQPNQTFHRSTSSFITGVVDIVDIARMSTTPDNPRSVSAPWPTTCPLSGHAGASQPPLCHTSSIRTEQAP